MMFSFIAKHRGIWAVSVLCEALGVSRSGFYAWPRRGPSARSRREEMLSAKIRASFADSDRTPAFAGAGSTARGECGTTC
jgi:putative transposase